MRRMEDLGTALAIYGDASSTLCTGPLGIVVRHEKSDRDRVRHGPMTDDHSGLVVAVAGHFSLVDPPTTADSDPVRIGCARWVLQRWASSGPRILDEIAGSFTLVVADPKAGRLSLWRDHLGDLKVYHHLDDRRLIAATEAEAILHDPSVTQVPDEHSIARFLGFRFGHTERSFFRGICELAPAHRIEVSPAHVETTPYWRFPSGPITVAEHEIPEAFLGLLHRSVHHHMGGLPAEQIALSLSGGLDSTTLAAVAPRNVRAYSWVFKATPDPAEEANIAAVSSHLGLPVHRVVSDAFGPLSGDFHDRFGHRSSPYLNPFAALKEHLYATARNDGCRRVIVGDGGDVLFGASHYWLRDALAQGRPPVLSSLVRTIRRAINGDPFSRASLRRLVPLPTIGRAVARRRTPSWLTDEGTSLLPEEPLSPILPEGRTAHRIDPGIGARNVELESEERRLFFQCGVERANPFWHRPLLEMALRLPATWSHFDGHDKVLIRESMTERLPNRVLESGRVGLLGDFFLRGIEAHRPMITDLLFRGPRSDWQHFVRREWVEPFLSATESITFGHTILWRVISYELWARRVS